MRRSRPIAALLAIVATLSVGGCGSSGGSGVPDAKIVAALGLTTVNGNYVIDKNPFCSVQKLLHDSTEVKDAASSGLVLASKDATVGIKVISPFAPACRKNAEKALQKLAKKQ
jgi:predicted small lipoprotein YifL